MGIPVVSAGGLHANVGLLKVAALSFIFWNEDDTVSLHQ